MGALANGIQVTPVKYGAQPTSLGTFSAFGDPAVADTANIRLDVNTAPGLHDLASGGANLFTCEQCVFGYQDAGTAGQKLFVADTGSLLLALKVSPQQTVGALSNVTLRESVNAPPLSAPTGAARWFLAGSASGSASRPGTRCARAGATRDRAR
ncbi:hypothetical protein OV208_38155 [Corallococcus sp. bb12-1]|uniref:hypothetical protein n=1 Tax=Corallococcus sp. bb12-1 TaxID=2996784 RepID=UPI00226FB6CA|nr:hypothetical protein [Corallococcus sp. bb12-1]MCY1047189.1 hypothetical protein [Corallococcus sp. bb12-1]